MRKLIPQAPDISSAGLSLRCQTTGMSFYKKWGITLHYTLLAWMGRGVLAGHRAADTPMRRISINSPGARNRRAGLIYLPGPC